MKQEAKELLLKDLCGRLPYGVRCEVNTHTERLDSVNPFEEAATFGFQSFDVSEVKPYLRPMESMTEEEESEYNDLNCYELGIFPSTVDAFDYLLKHHFDYRDLIERGLAIEVTEESNPYKE